MSKLLVKGSYTTAQLNLKPFLSLPLLTHRPGCRIQRVNFYLALISAVIEM